MPLMAHKTPRIEVPLLAGNTVFVRGINLDDFMSILPNHIEAMSKIASLYAQHQQSIFSGRAFSDFLVATARDFPGLIAEVISICADEPEAKDVKLSTGLQIAILSAIVKLTIEEAGGLGNLFAQVREMGEKIIAARIEQANNSQKRSPFKSSTGPGANR